MFDFLFKRKISKPTPSKSPVQIPASPPPEPPGQAKLAAVTQAQALQGEDAAVDFILQCQFADARLIAVEQVQTRAGLERVLKAVRNSDRRVAKVAQSRIDAIANRETSEQHAQRGIAEATRLLQQTQLMPNQVADLDRQWKAAGNVSPALQQTFDEVRSALGERLQAQATLQRAVIDTIVALKDLVARANELDPTDVSQSLTLLEARMAESLASRDASSLPSQLAEEFNQRQTAFRQSLALIALRYQSLQIRKQKLDEWESEPPETRVRDTLKREWHALPALQDDELSSQLQARFDALLPPPIEIVKPKPSKDLAAPRAAVRNPDADKQFAEALDAMEKALEDGAIRVASEHDKLIRSMDVKAARLTDAQSAQLSRARSELGRMQGWAKWGGTVSREELLKAADGMAGQEMAPAELAKKVGSLRERWKSLDTSSGPATRELWERFDAACTTAYAPAAEHFKKLSEERQQNQLKAQEMIASIAAFAATLHGDIETQQAADWKGVAQFCMRTTQAWQRLGTIDRREKKKLDAEFDDAMNLLAGPLSAQRSAEIARREQLIEDAGNLRATDRSAPDMLRALQERWQEQSKSLPLERKDEQELWLRFRSACDAVFAKRKEAAVSADADRRIHLQEKEALCAALESSQETDEQSIARVMREARDAWARIGPVPHAAEGKLEARYTAAVTALQVQLDVFKSAESAREVNALRRKLGVCRAAEDVLLAGAGIDAATIDKLRHDWEETEACPAEFDRVMRKRFDAAIAALESSDSGYAATVETNRSALLAEILRFEIVAGIDSPVTLSRERLQLQVEVLQSSLKAGVKPVPQRAQLLALCGMPAAVDADTAVRLDLVIGAAKGVISA